MKSGIYKIRNIQNNNVYIGSAVNIKGRWISHLYMLKKGNHHSKYLQNAWIKYGESAFEFSVIEYCNKEDLVHKEQYYIDAYKPSYNMSPTAGSQIGVKHSEESRRKSGAANIGKVPWNKGKSGVYSDETKSKMSEAKKGKSGYWKGKEKSKEHIEKIGKASKNRPPEVIAKMSLARKLWWQNKKKEVEQFDLVIKQGCISINRS